MDSFTLESSALVEEATTQSFELSDRQLLYLSDQNGLQYNNGIVQFTTQALSQRGGYIDWKNSYLEIPLVLQMNSPTANFTFSASKENAFAASLKGSLVHLIHSMTVSCGSEIIKTVPFNNISASFDLISNMSTEDVENFASSICWGKDSSLSHAYNGVIGSNNVYLKDVAFSPETGFGSFSQNKGRVDRMKHQCMGASDTAISTLVAATGTTYSQFDDTYKGYFKQQTATALGWIYTAVIPLRILHDFFNQMCLAKNAVYQIAFNCNAPSTCVTTYAGANVGATAPTSFVSSVPNAGTLPFQISHLKNGTSTGTGLLMDGTAAGGVITTSLTIGTSPSGDLSHSLKTCRLYLSHCQLTPESETQYLARPQKSFAFRENYFAPISKEIAPSGSVQVQLHTGLQRLRRLLIVPMISQATNGTNAVSPIQSPYASEPATTSPMCGINNLNVRIGGKALYEQNVQYKFENFLTEVRPLNSVFGGASLGSSTGLISSGEYDINYGFIAIDLSRHDRSVDNMPMGLEVMFNNKSKFTCDFYYIIQYENQITFDVQAGLIVA